MSTKRAFDKFDLSGKTALITGAAGLLGIEHSTALLDSGATVVLTDIDAIELDNAREKLLSNAESARIIMHQMDITQQAAI